MKLTFLEASMPLTKSFTKNADGTITKSSYPNAYEVTTIEEQCSNMKHFATLLAKHAALGHCLLKGNPTRPLNQESRAGTTDSHATTEWIVLDLDGIQNCATVEDFLRAMSLDPISYVVQWSASMGIPTSISQSGVANVSNDLRAHIFMELHTPLAAPLLKQWLVGLNHSVALLRDTMSLTKTGNAISWPLDTSACQNDKLLYIAPPVLKGIRDPMARKPRIEYIQKKNDVLNITSIPSAAANQTLTTTRINELRIKANLPPRKNTYKLHGTTQVLAKPDVCVMTDIKTERGFVYLNINGGDSWGYFHPEDNPDFIRNFKDEPIYVTKELLPDYWAHLTQSATRISSQGITYLAFTDAKSSAYWRGTHDTITDTLELNRAPSERILRDFAKQHGMPLGDFIPEWDRTFDPQDNVRVDAVNKTINTFQPTVYMQQVTKPVAKCPPTILRVLHHALGCDLAITEHFINWIAFILQKRSRSKTAWVLHGTQGTGKGILMNNILRPIFGFTQTAACRMDNLNEKWNGFLEKCFLVFVDEVESKALINERGVMANLKNFITEKMITIREMNLSPYEVLNFTNWIFASNKPDPVSIDKEDRRFNVGKYQKNKLIITDKELDKLIPNELQAFHDYLMNFSIDETAASTPIETEDRDNMIDISETSADAIATAILDGNMELFIDQLPTTNTYESNAVEFNKVENYRALLKTLLLRTLRPSRGPGFCNISRDELRILFDYTVGNIPTTPNKFTIMLKHKRIRTTKVWIADKDKAVYGIQVIWKDHARFDDYLKGFNPAPQNGAKKKVKA